MPSRFVSTPVHPVTWLSRSVVLRPAFGLANEHPRVDLLHPGPGVGGHCLPVDPLYLAHHSDHARLTEHARAVNDGMGPYMRELLEDALGSLAGARVAVFGLDVRRL